MSAFSAQEVSDDDLERIDAEADSDWDLENHFELLDRVGGLRGSGLECLPGYAFARAIRCQNLLFDDVADCLSFLLQEQCVVTFPEGRWRYEFPLRGSFIEQDSDSEALSAVIAHWRRQVDENTPAPS